MWLNLPSCKHRLRCAKKKNNVWIISPGVSLRFFFPETCERLSYPAENRCIIFCIILQQKPADQPGFGISLWFDHQNQVWNGFKKWGGFHHWCYPNSWMVRVQLWRNGNLHIYLLYSKTIKNRFVGAVSWGGKHHLHSDMWWPSKPKLAATKVSLNPIDCRKAARRWTGRAGHVFDFDITEDDQWDFQDF